MPGLLSKANTASDVWADWAYRSNANAAYFAGNGFRSCIHRKKPPGKPMARRIARANGETSEVRAAVNYVFAQQKGPMGLGVRTIGLARAWMEIGLANLIDTQGRYDVVILDANRPDKRGDALVPELLALHADLPVLIASGESASEIEKRFARNRCVGVLPKPYTVAKLTYTLRELGLRCVAPPKTG